MEGGDEVQFHFENTFDTYRFDDCIEIILKVMENGFGRKSLVLLKKKIRHVSYRFDDNIETSLKMTLDN